MAQIFHRFGLRYSQRHRRVTPLPSTPGSITITGVSATGSAGTATARVDTGALTGVSGTGAAGTAVAQVSAIISGVFGLGQVGTLTIQQGPVGVQGDGRAGSPVPAVSATLIGVSGTGQVGTPFGVEGVLIVGVSGTGIAGDVYPIPPAPRSRPPLFIPVENGLPASLWLGSTNGD